MSFFPNGIVELEIIKMDPIIWKIKMPEHWRPFRVVPSLSVFLPKVLLTVILFVCGKYNCSLWLTDTQMQLTVWRHDKTYYGTFPKLKLKRKIFKMATLTFDLDFVKVDPHAKFREPRSNSSAVRELSKGHTHRHTNGTDFIPSTADMGGKKLISALNIHCTTLKVHWKPAVYTQCTLRMFRVLGVCTAATLLRMLGTFSGQKCKVKLTKIRVDTVYPELCICFWRENDQDESG